ncbi:MULTISPECIES: dipeptide ABC transporter ATP-binding protein [unclassified Arthrobacter]|uniref:dipeptide ABC transporter ATP-binding protein n=1 Tax=unclassified Arthrobacter TaxID=235627 RepID=UPI004033EAF1
MNGPSLLRVEGLQVGFAGTPVVHDVGLDVGRGECLALVGESGSGKSVTARALLGLSGRGARVDARRWEFDGASLHGAGPRQWRRLRGTRIGLVLQDALVSLDPLRTIGREIDDSLRLHTSLSAASRGRRVAGLLESMGLQTVDAGRRAGELSGGMRQRALIASAMALDPELLIADEPTTALDAESQAQVLGVLASLRSGGSSLLLISHDLAVVSSVADRVAIMRGGRIVEQGPTATVLSHPEHEYTRMLLRAVPAGRPRGTRLSVAPADPGAPEPVSLLDPVPESKPRPVSGPGSSQGTVLEARHLSRTFAVKGGEDFRAVDDVGLRVEAGRTLGLVGASGSGKSTTARILLGLEEPDEGTVELFGGDWVPGKESSRRARRPLLGAVYQDALSSFDPRRRVGAILADALTTRGGGAGADGGWGADSPEALLELVGLAPGLTGRHPRTLSGGQRQRVAIARALAPGPRVLICDEPVSSLDVSVQARILDLLDDLQARFGLGYLFISHDLAVVRHVSDRLAVMRQGRIVESGATEEVFAAPQHPYTRALLAASPTLATG